MMIRLLAFAMNASDTLEFTKGLSTDDEPELWQKSLSDEIELWIDLGLPEEDRIRKACNRSQRVILYTYGGRGVPVWWDKHHNKLERFGNLTIIDLAAEQTTRLPALPDAPLTFQESIQAGEVTSTNASNRLSIT